MLDLSGVHPSVFRTSTFVCQACGHTVVIRGVEVMHYVTFWLGGILFALGVLLLPFSFVDDGSVFLIWGMVAVGAGTLALSASSEWARWRHPRARGVPAPAVAYLPAARRCTCGQLAPCVRLEVAQQGLTFHHHCPACDAPDFAVDDAFHTIYRLTLAFLLAAVASGLAVHGEGIWAVVGGAAAGIAGGASLAQGVRRLVHRARHPTVAVPLATWASTDGDPGIPRRVPPANEPGGTPR